MPSAATNPSVAGVLKRPFDEQVAFFRGKMGNLIPTRTWKDVQKSAHDTGFMVAGAARADLLADLASAVDRSISEGKSIDAFRKDFDAIVDKHGWNHTGGRIWRTRVIYTTNMATSYAAGRLAQLRAGKFKYWMYRHSDSVLYPRPDHLAWNKMVLRADDPWWHTHFPPNGWGCHCRVVGISGPAMARALGGRMVDRAPDDAIDPGTGAPAGIDPGWDYMPGDTVSRTVGAMAEKATHWAPPLARGYMRGVPDGVRDSLALAYRALPSVADDARRYANRIMGGRTGLEIQDSITLGLLTGDESATVARLTGVDANLFDFSLSADAIAGMAVDAGDMAMAPILPTGARMRRTGTSADGRPLVSLSRWIDGQNWTATYAVSEKDLRLVLVGLKPGGQV